MAVPLRALRVIPSDRVALVRHAHKRLYTRSRSDTVREENTHIFPQSGEKTTYYFPRLLKPFYKRDLLG